MMTEEKRIKPSDEVFTYSGRIDFEEKDAPVFVFPCSSIRFIMSGKTGRLVIENVHAGWENALGILVDGVHAGKMILPGTSGRGTDEAAEILPEAVQRNGAENLAEMELDFSEFLDGGEHEITIFKRQDTCHQFIFKGLIVEADGTVKKAAAAPSRKIEVYGDSVSAGEVSEAVDYMGVPDPEHNGEFSNSYYSYAWTLARKLNAELHDIAQGGISLLDGEGYFAAPDYKGMLSCYDKIEYAPNMLPIKPWDFSRYTPHVVIVAIGQNDSHPANYMGEDYDGGHAAFWRSEYGRFVSILREKYPQAHIILTTTILAHDSAWDRAIDEVAESLHDDKVHHFLYKRNGCGTHGHIRIPEAEEMAEELAAYIEGLENVWK